MSAAERVEHFLLGKSFRLLTDERDGSDLPAHDLYRNLLILRQFYDLEN